MGQAMKHELHDKPTDDMTPSTVSDARSRTLNEQAVGADRVASRRYILLKGIGRGSAILAAAVPINTLASVPSVTANGQLCSVSGTHSAVHSQATQLPTCGGLSPGYYMKIEHWPNSPATTYTVGVKIFNQNTKFSTVFGAGMKVPMLTIMQTPPNNNDEFHWIAALLNAIKAPAGYVFPYSASEVLALYAGTQQMAALTFFKGFMETI